MTAQPVQQTADAPGHPVAPHVDVRNGQWVGREAGANDPHFQLAHPWEHGRFTGPTGSQYVWRIRSGNENRFDVGGYYFQVSQYDDVYTTDWLWNSDDIVIYPDLDHARLVPRLQRAPRYVRARDVPGYVRAACRARPMAAARARTGGGCTEGSRSMLDKAKALLEYKLNCMNEEIGSVKEFYFDDRHWAIRYSGRRYGSVARRTRQVLISPHAVNTVSRERHRMVLGVTKRQIEDAPWLAPEQPVSPQFEDAYHAFHGWPKYWRGQHVGLVASSGPGSEIPN